jgi:multiple sugar transport system permease protein
MSAHSITEPSRRQKWIAGVLVATYAVITLLPLLWIIATGFKSSSDAIAYPPKVLFEPTLEGYVNLFTIQTRQTPEYLAANPPTTWYEEVVSRMLWKFPSGVLRACEGSVSQAARSRGIGSMG